MERDALVAGADDLIRAAPAVLAPLSPGPQAVATLDRALPARAGRDEPPLQVRIHHPLGGGPYPVLLFSHGLGGSRLGYGFLGKSWASHGYVCIHPSHEASGGEVLRGGAVSRLLAMKRAIDDQTQWAARPAELSRVLDQLDELEQAAAALSGRLDRTRVGIAGHSYGAYTALLCAGAEPLVDGAALRAAEPRACAFVLLSPPGPHSRGLTEASFARVERPVLCVTGTRDAGLHGEPPSWREETYRCLPPGDKQLLVIEGADHATFAGGRAQRDGNGRLVRKTDPESERQIRTAEVATREFWDLMLKGRGAGVAPPSGARLSRK